MKRRQAIGWLAVAGGLGLALAVQVLAPVGVPLYDGVVVAEPYRYLHPTAADQAGDPTTASSSEDVAGGVSPVFAAATMEQPPQAQLIAQSGAFEVPAGTTSLKISITPVDPEAQPTAGSIAGNVYRYAVQTQAGAPVLVNQCDTCLSLVLRTPPEVTDGQVAHLANGAWVPVTTFHAGSVAMFQANAGTLGDFAVITGAGPLGATGGLDPLIFGGVALALFFAAVAGLFWYRRRPPPVPATYLGTGRGRIPSKRKAARRPPSGRSRE